MEVSKKDKTIKAIVETAYPEYRGRKIRLEPTADDREFNLNSYWDGGSHDYFAFVRLADMATIGVEQNGTMFDRKNYHSQIPPGVVLVEHTIFCGKDCGIRIYVRHSDMTPLLPASTI